MASKLVAERIGENPIANAAGVCKSALPRARDVPVGYGSHASVHQMHCSDLRDLAQTGERSALALHEFPFGGTKSAQALLERTHSLKGYEQKLPLPRRSKRCRRIQFVVVFIRAF